MRGSGQGVGVAVGHPGPVDDGELVVGQGGEPALHVAVHGLHRVQVPQGLVVSSEDKGPVPQVVLPGLAEVQHGHQLPLGGRVVGLAFGQALRPVHDDPLPSVLHLGEDGADGVGLLAPVRVQDEGLVGVELWVSQDGSVQQRRLQLLEGGQHGGRDLEGLLLFLRLPFSCHGHPRPCHGAVILNEFAVVADLAQEDPGL